MTLLSVTEAARRLGIHRSSVRNYIVAGLLRPERVRPPYVFSEETIATFTPPRQGRPRLYASAAEKQRAYRERKAARSDADYPKLLEAIDRTNHLLAIAYAREIRKRVGLTASKVYEIAREEARQNS